MNFSQLELIRAIQEKGSISAAADTVGFTQSAASRALSTLEDELGVTLVNRTRNGGVLTEIGKHLLPHIYEILTHAEYIRQDAAARRGLSVGKLRIGSIPSMSARLLSQLLGAFRYRYPGVETVVFEGNEAEILTWIQQGIVDIGLVAYVEEDGNVVPIARDELKIVVSENHSLADRTSIQISDLANEPFVMSRFGCVPLIHSLFQEAHIPLNLQFELSDVNTVLAMVQEGLGVTMIPQLSLPEHLSTLRALSLNPPQYRYLRAVCNNIKSASPATCVFIELARGFTGYSSADSIQPTFDLSSAVLKDK